MLRFFLNSVFLLYLGDTLLGELLYVSEARLCNSHARTEQDVFQIPFHVTSVFLFATLDITSHRSGREKPITHPHTHTHYMPCNHSYIHTCMYIDYRLHLHN